MGGSGRRVAVDLNQNDVGGISEILHHVKSEEPRLVQGGRGIDSGGGQELGNLVWNNVNVDMNYEHERILTVWAAKTPALLGKSQGSSPATRFRARE